jgi:tetratricopeptide (TPR) repeat protein
MDKQKVEIQAEKLIKKGKFEEAIFTYQKLLTGEDQDYQIKNIIGDLYIKAGDKERAIREFNKIADFYEQRGIYSKCIAITRKIAKLVPDDIEVLSKLASLYRERGLISEAKSAYNSLSQLQIKQNQPQDAVSSYKNILEITPNDISTRLSLADLYEELEESENSLEELNKVIELYLRAEEYENAERLLERARQLKEEDFRTLTNSIFLFKKTNRKKEALDLIHDLLQKDPENIPSLYLLGDLYLEEDQLEEALRAFSQIVSLRPKELNAHVRTGKVYIQDKKYDKAFETFTPIIEHFIKHRKDNKAIGLIGLILRAKNNHLPSLEKLASIYKDRKQRNHLEITYKVLLTEYLSLNLRDQSLYIIDQLIDIVPDDKALLSKYKQLQKELGLPTKGPVPPDDKEQQIERTLAKINLYLEQGLIRNAKRILDQLKHSHPDDPRVNQKVIELSQFAKDFSEEDLLDRVEKASARETEILAEVENETEEKKEKLFTAAEIFADTDIAPFAAPGDAEREYFDLTDTLHEELKVIRDLSLQQERGGTSAVEKGLREIVSEFRKAVDKKIEKDNYESRYNLGIAFLEQDLLDEAIAEFILAAEDDFFKLDCLTLISRCHRKKNELPESLEWAQKALALADEGSKPSIALKYEIAELYSEMGDNEKALNFFQDVQEQSPDYREVEEKINNLKSQK